MVTTVIPYAFTLLLSTTDPSSAATAGKKTNILKIFSIFTPYTNIAEITAIPNNITPPTAIQFR